MAPSATFESISEEVVGMLVSLSGGERQITSGSRLNQSQCGEPSIKLWRKRGHSAAVLLASARRVAILEVPPALVRAARPGRNVDERGRADDVDATVVAILDPQDLL